MSNNNLLLDDLNSIIHNLTEKKQYIIGNDFEMYVFLNKFKNLLESGRLHSELTKKETENFTRTIRNFFPEGETQHD